MHVQTKTAYSVKSGVTFSKPICAKEGEKWPTQCRPWPFQSQPQQPPCASTLCLNPPIPSYFCQCKIYLQRQVTSCCILVKVRGCQLASIKNKGHRNIYSNIFHALCMSLKLIYDSCILLLHTKSAGSGVQVPTADIPSGDIQVALILPARTNPGMHLRTTSVALMFSMIPFSGTGGVLQLTGGRNFIVCN